MRVSGWSELWDRLVASDPGLTRLQSAGSAAIAMSSALAVEYGHAHAIHDDAQGILIAMLLGAIVAMMGSMALTGLGAWTRVRVAVFFPVAMGIGMLAGVAVGGHTDLMLSVFVVVMFVAVFVRRFGPAFFFYGFMAWMGYFFAAFLHATTSMLPSLITDVAIGSAWVLLLSLTVLRGDSTRTLRRIVRAFGAQASAVARAGADLLEVPGDEPARARRAGRRLRAHQARLAEVALMVEAWSAEPHALPPGRSAPALRRHLLDAQQTLDDIATSAGTLSTGDRRLAEPAAAVLRRLARRDHIGVVGAAHALVAAADREAADARPAARLLSAAALEFVALTRLAGMPPAPADSSEVDVFSPAVVLAMGNLPGAPAVASDVAARGGHWNPLARLDMTSRQAIQVAVAGALAILAGRELSSTRYYWAVIAAFIMFTGTGTRAETFVKGSNRVLGTLVGLLVSIWAANLTAGHTSLVLLVIVASMFCGFYLVRLSYAYMIFFVTIMVGQLYSVLHEFSDGLLVLRLEETAIGAAIGFAVALVVLPLSTRDTVRSARDALLRDLSRLLRAAAVRLDGSPAADDESDLDQLARGLDDRIRQLALVAKPLTRPLVWGNSPPRTRHRLVLYAAAAGHARGLAVALRRHSPVLAGPASASPVSASLVSASPVSASAVSTSPVSTSPVSTSPVLAGPASACRALADAACHLTGALPGQSQPGVAEILATADAALFATDADVNKPDAHVPEAILRPLVHLCRLLNELAATGRTAPTARRASSGVDGAGRGESIADHGTMGR